MNIPVLYLSAGVLIAETVPPHWDPPMVIVGKLTAIAVLVALNAFFVACEFSVVKVRTTQLDALLEEGNVQARFVKHVRGATWYHARKPGAGLDRGASASIHHSARPRCFPHLLFCGGNVDCCYPCVRWHHLFAHRVRRARTKIRRHFGATACRASSDATARRFLCFV